MRNLSLDLSIIPFSLWKKRLVARSNLIQGPRSHELNVDFDRQIRPFIKKGRDIPSQCTIKIDLLNNLSNDENRNMRPNCYTQLACLYDASRYFVLVCERNASRFGAAVLGFELKGSCFRIIQIQGLSCDDSPEIMIFLAHLKWERLLVSFAENWARDNGFLSVMIKKSYHNRYYYGDQGEYYNERNLRLKMHYDVTARRSGYGKSLVYRKYWVKGLV